MVRKPPHKGKNRRKIRGKRGRKEAHAVSKKVEER